MKGRREFLKDMATGDLILSSQNEFGLVGMLELRRNRKGGGGSIAYGT